MKYKNTGLKIIIVITLIISVAGLSLGFANYASNLKIESSAKYKLNIEDQPMWLVSFDAPSYVSALVINATHEIPQTGGSNKITRYIEPSSGSTTYSLLGTSCTDEYEEGNYDQEAWGGPCDDIEFIDGTIDGLTVSGIKVSFKNLAAAASYEIPIGNFGLVDAYLKSVTFTGNKTCTAAAGATISNDVLNAICDNVDVVFEFNDVTYSNTTTNISTNNKLESGMLLITGLQIGLRSSDDALSNITYDKINISIPDITLGFSSVN